MSMTPEDMPTFWLWNDARLFLYLPLTNAINIRLERDSMALNIQCVSRLTGSGGRSSGCRTCGSEATRCTAGPQGGHRTVLENPESQRAGRKRST